MEASIQGKSVSTSEHEAHVCRDCLAQSITAQVNSSFWNQVTCPAFFVLPSWLMTRSTGLRLHILSRYQAVMIADTLNYKPCYRNYLHMSCLNG